MSIQIIDNFEVRVQKAIDNRFVVGTGQFYTNKDDIDYKYAGLRVWDLDLSIPYVWTGVTWSSEATASITGSGTIGTIPKFIGLTNNIGDSVIKESSSNIGIGLAGSPTEKLDVNGNVKATKFIGLAWSGLSGLTNINLGTNGSNVIGTIGLANIQNGSQGNILIGGSSTPQWSDQVQIGTAPTSGAPGNGLYFKNTITSRLYATSGSGLRFTIGTTDTLDVVEGQIRVRAFNDAGSPALSFIGDTNTGIYNVSGDTMGFSTDGTQRLRISTTDVVSSLPIKVPNGSISNPSYTFTNSTSTGIWYSQSGAGVNTIRLLRFSLSGSEMLYFENSLLFALGTGARAVFNSNVYLKDGTVSYPGLAFGSDFDTGIYRVSNDTIGISTNGTKRLEINNSGININSTSYIKKVWVGAISLTYNMGGAGVTSINDYSALPPGWSYTSGDFSTSFYGTGGGYITLTAPSNWSNTDLVSVSANMRYALLSGGSGSQDNFGFTITPSINSNGITFYFRRVSSTSAGTPGSGYTVGSIAFMFTAIERN